VVASSDDRTTLEGVFVINFKEIAEQLANEVGPEVETKGTGTGSTTVMAGSVVGNISVGKSNL
jgi:hypothetical protein